MKTDAEYKLAYNNHKARAKHRKERWDISFEDWLDLWGDYIDMRGRASGTYQMTRIDFSKPWSYENCVLFEVGTMHAEKIANENIHNQIAE